VTVGPFAKISKSSGGAEVLNPDGKTLQFRYLSALAAKFIDNIRINIDNIRINVDDFPAKLVPLD